MKKSFNRYLLFILILVVGLLGTSCKSIKRGSRAKLKSRTSAYLLKKIDQQKLDVEWVAAKGKLHFKDDNYSIGANAYVRMKKDSAIWIVAKKFGFEAVRVLITPDSVYALDRLNNEYRIKDLTYLQQQFSLPIKFNDLQDILLGNAILIPDKENLTALVDSTQYHLMENSADLKKDFWIDGINYYTVKMSFVDDHYKRSALIEYRNHQKGENAAVFSYFRSLQFNSPETGNVAIELDFSKVELNTPKSLSFEIPSHYTRVD